MAVLLFESADEIIKCVDHSIKATVSLALKISTIWTKYRQSYDKVSLSCFVAFYENRF